MDELKNIESKLSGIKKDNPFKLPDGYFDSFQQRLTDRIEAEQSGSKVWRFLTFTRPQLIYISSFVVIVLITFGLFKLINNREQVPQLTHNEIADLIEEDIYNYEEEMLVETYAELEIEEDVVVESVIEEPVTNITGDNNYTEEIIDYLTEEDIDLESIVLEL